MKCGYDCVEHATYDTYHPLHDLGKPQQDKDNYTQDGELVAMPLSAAINDKKSIYYMQDTELSKITKEQIALISKTMTYGPYDA